MGSTRIQRTLGVLDRFELFTSEYSRARDEYTDLIEAKLRSSSRKLTASTSLN